MRNRDTARSARDVPAAGATPRLRLEVPGDPRERVDVGPPFRRFNSGWLALDFVNTVPGWVRAAGGAAQPAGERLVRYGDLLLWSERQHLLGDAAAAELRAAAGRARGRAAAVVARARVVRGALHALFSGAARGLEPAAGALALLDAEQVRLRRHEHLVAEGTGAVLQWVSAASELEVLLWPPVRSAVALLTAPELLARVGECGGPACGWLFLDLGRGRARRWCDSRDCGNVAKARAFRARHRRS